MLNSEFLDLVGSNTKDYSSENIDDLIKEQLHLAKIVVDLNPLSQFPPGKLSLLQSLDEDLDKTIAFLTTVLLADSKQYVISAFHSEIKSLLNSIREMELKLLIDSSLLHRDACSLLFINGIITSTLFVACSFFLHKCIKFSDEKTFQTIFNSDLRDAAYFLSILDIISIRYNAPLWTSRLAIIFHGYVEGLETFIVSHGISYHHYFDLLCVQNPNPDDLFIESILEVMKYSASFRFSDHSKTVQKKQSDFSTAIPRITAMQIVHWGGFGSTGDLFAEGSLWQPFPTISYGMNFEGTMFKNIIVEMRSYFPIIFEAWWKSYGRPKQAQIFEDAAGVFIPTSTAIANHIANTHDKEFFLNVTCCDIIWKNLKILNEEKGKKYTSWCKNLKVEQVFYRNMMQTHSQSNTEPERARIFDIDGDSPPRRICGQFDAYLCSLAWHQTGDRDNKIIMKRLLYFCAKLVKPGGLLFVVEPRAERCYIVNIPIAINLVDRDGGFPEPHELFEPLEGEPEHYKCLNQLWKFAKDNVPEIMEIEQRVEKELLKKALHSLILLRTHVTPP